MIAALIPVKRLDAGKSRLVASLGRPAVERLTVAMLGDVIAALRGVPRLAPVAVVTPDAAVTDEARRANVLAFVEPDAGLNPSLESAARALVTHAHRGLLVVLGDVAGVGAAELETLLDAGEAQGEPGVTIAPSSDGGTSALLRQPAHAIEAHFGIDSAARHREAAKQAGVAFQEIPLPSLAVDLDCEEDLRAFLASDGGGPRTRAVLDELGWGRP